MKTYLLSLGAGLLVGVIDGLLNVRSPAPPVIALLGILLGKQLVPIAKRLIGGEPVTVSALRRECGQHVFGQWPTRPGSKGTST
ncbi:XapX domain-containing protein [Roseomonas sp. CCTCC AB2023176]|uniref:XapX domain-containing protein n=1 Tax=Roseomonas sp. CCTCC AB2023176 TaxID=3342640 RepID=UPI0035E0577C